jgi:hypothetical protein
MIRPISLAELATEAAYAFERGPEALTELESEVTTCAERAMELKTEADKATSDLTTLARLEGENRDARARLRSQHQKDNAADLDLWQRGGKDDLAKQAARATGQVSQIAFLTERDVYATNTLRPKLQLLSQRKDAGFAVASADALFAQAMVAAYHRHAALQQAVEVDGIAQLPAEGGKANMLWRQATALMGRAGEISASADFMESQISVRERSL